jgi:hypothetical protein
MAVAERRQLLRTREKQLRATGSGQEAASGELEGIDPGAGENGHRGAEQRIVRRFCLQCSMPCMPVVSQAGNQVTWNHFFLGGVESRARAVPGISIARIGLCYPDIPDLTMFRILGFLLLAVVLALSFGWHPLATVKDVMRQRESYQAGQGFNWLQQRKRSIEDAERKRRERSDVGHGSVPVVDPATDGIVGPIPYGGTVRERAGGINDELFQSSIPTYTSTTAPGSKQK